MKKPTTNKGYYRHRETYKGVTIDLKSLSERELAEKVREKKNAIDSGDDVMSPDISVERWCDTWLDTYKKPTITEKGYDNYRYIIKNQIKPALGKYKVKAIKPVILQQLLNDLNENDKSFSFINRVKVTLNAIFDLAVENGYINKNPASALVTPAAKDGTHRALTEEETAALIGVGEANPHYLYTMFLFYTGIRPQEAIALTWSDVDIKNKLLNITKAVESGNKNIKSTKTKAGIRTIPIPDALIELIKAGEPDALIFPNDNGKQADKNSCARWWKATRRAINIYLGCKVVRNEVIEPKLPEDFTAYCLRHTYCTNLQRSGVPLNVAKVFMGHRDIKMTANIYGHQTDDQTEAARALINLHFKPETVTNAGTK